MLLVSLCRLSISMISYHFVSFFSFFLSTLYSLFAFATNFAIFHIVKKSSALLSLYCNVCVSNNTPNFFQLQCVTSMLRCYHRVFHILCVENGTLQWARKFVGNTIERKENCLKLQLKWYVKCKVWLKLIKLWFSANANETFFSLVRWLVSFNETHSPSCK